MSKGDKNRTKDREAYRETMERIKRNEEKKGEEKGKDLEIEILENIKQDFTTFKINLVDILRSRNDNYRSYSKELTSPPPEPCI